MLSISDSNFSIHRFYRSINIFEYLRKLFTICTRMTTALICFILACCFPTPHLAKDADAQTAVQGEDFVMKCYDEPSRDYYVSVLYDSGSEDPEQILQYEPKTNETSEEATSPFYKRIAFTTKRELILRNVKVADEGTFSCVLGGFKVVPTEMSKRLVVYVAPQIELKKLTDPLVAGSSPINVAQCTAKNGKPEAQVSWSTNRHLEFNHTDSNSSGTEPLTSTRISVLYVTPTEFYNNQPFMCTVTHPAFDAGKASTISLNVNFPPKKPTITVRDSGTMLYCSSDGNPEPSLVWSLPPVAPAPTHAGTSVKMMDPQNPERQNDTYICTASNGIGDPTFVSITTGEASTIVEMVDQANTGLIVGVVIGCILLILIVCALVYWFVIRRSKEKDSGPYNPKLSTNTSTDSPWGRSKSSEGRPTIQHANESLNKNRPPSPSQPPPHDDEENKGSLSSHSDMEDQDGHDVDVPLVEEGGYEDMPESGIVSKNSVNFRQRRQRPSTSPHRRSQKSYPEPSPRTAPQAVSHDQSPDNPHYEVPPMDYYQDEPYDDEEAPLAHGYPQQAMDDRFYDLPEDRYPQGYQPQERYDGGLPPYTQSPEVQYTSIDHSYNGGGMRQRPPYEPVEYAEIRSHAQIV